MPFLESYMEKLPLTLKKANILIPCVKCDEYVAVAGLQKHREIHRAWKILRCNGETVPKTMKQLLRKRRQIINNAMSKIEPGNLLPTKVLQNIDWAFDVVRKTTSQSSEGISAAEDAITINKYAPHSTSLSEECISQYSTDLILEGESEELEYCGQAVGICHCPNSKWRTTNEDRHSYKEDTFYNSTHGFFGLFDGYNGAAAAEKCSSHFYDFLKGELKLGSNNVDFAAMSESEVKEREHVVKQAIRNSFSKMDSFLLTGESESSKIRWSGTSAAVCYIENDTLYVANAGNVRALFIKGDGSAVSLVTDHTLKNKKERDRLRRENGRLSFNEKVSMVNGLVSSTRGLGNHGDPNLKSAVISRPNITVSMIDPSDQFLVLYTAGISDVFSDDEVMLLLEDIIPDMAKIETLRKHIVEQSQEKDSFLNEPARDFIAEGQNVNENLKDEAADYGKAKESFYAEDNGTECNDPIAEKSPVVSFHEKALEADTSSKLFGRMSNEAKPSFLATALVERLVYSALLADTRENTTALAVLLHGCPINLYLLPSVEKKSAFQRDLPKVEAR